MIDSSTVLEGIFVEFAKENKGGPIYYMEVYDKQVEHYKNEIKKHSKSPKGSRST